MSHAFSLGLGRRFIVALGTAAALLLGGAALAAEPAVNTLKNSLLGGRTDTAINGYDTVAYFTVGKPVKGTDSLVYEWMGAKWKFSTQAHLDQFKAMPEKFAPQYGGYCAYGVAQGHLVKVEPDQFTVLDGKLYLNYDADVQATWKKDVPGYIKAADAKYSSLLK
jgi:YHS domain-containing protein